MAAHPDAPQILPPNLHTIGCEIAAGIWQEIQFSTIDSEPILPALDTISVEEIATQVVTLATQEETVEASNLIERYFDDYDTALRQTRLAEFTARVRDAFTLEVETSRSQEFAPVMEEILETDPELAIHIDNLTDRITEEILKATLEQTAEVLNLEIHFGEAIVQFGSAEDAVKVMRCFDGVMIDGQYMVVNICGEHLYPEKQVNEEDEYAEWGCGAESDGSD